MTSAARARSSAPNEVGRTRLLMSSCEHAQLGLDPNPGGYEVVELGDNVGGHDEGCIEAGHHGPRRIVLRLGAVEEGEQSARIRDHHRSPKPASSSSARAAMGRSDSNTPGRGNGRRTAAAIASRMTSASGTPRWSASRATAALRSSGRYTVVFCTPHRVPPVVPGGPWRRTSYPTLGWARRLRSRFGVGTLSSGRKREHAACSPWLTHLLEWLRSVRSVEAPWRSSWGTAGERLSVLPWAIFATGHTGAVVREAIVSALDDDDVLRASWRCHVGRACSRNQPPCRRGDRGPPMRGEADRPAGPTARQSLVSPAGASSPRSQCLDERGAPDGRRAPRAGPRAELARAGLRPRGGDACISARRSGHPPRP